MAQWLIAPYWVAERRQLRDEAGRVYQIDYQTTEVRVTNPGNEEGRLELQFHELRGDHNYYESDWAGGIWTMPPNYQRHYRPDPSRRFGDQFIIYGWFEIWMSLDVMAIDISVTATTRNPIGGSAAGGGGVVENISQRTIQTTPNRRPIQREVTEELDREARSPFRFPPGLSSVIRDFDATALLRPGRDEDEPRS